MPLLASVVYFLAACVALAAGGKSATPSPTMVPDTAGLTWLVGTWIGSGTGLSGAIRDSMTFAPALGGRALRFTMVSTTSDGFEAEGYVWGSDVETVELVETSSADRMRRFRGTRNARGLVVDEEPIARATRVRLDLLTADSMRLQEIRLRPEPPRAFVDELFVRMPPSPRP